MCEIPNSIWHKNENSSSNTSSSPCFPSSSLIRFAYKSMGKGLFIGAWVPYRWLNLPPTAPINCLERAKPPEPLSTPSHNADGSILCRPPTGSEQLLWLYHHSHVTQKTSFHSTPFLPSSVLVPLYQEFPSLGGIMVVPHGGLNVQQSPVLSTVPVASTELRPIAEWQFSDQSWQQH